MREIITRIDGRAGRITLRRPQALNALNHGMVQVIGAALTEWADNPSVDLVLIEGEGQRAFCAGGDIADVYRAGRRGDFEYGRRFWTEEYGMNARIARYPKSYVALMQGYVMGGGVGISGHGSNRIVGETTQISMPECMIGLIPDVGATAILARSPGRLGEYLGITGYRMGPGDAILAGFADHFVPEACWSELVQALVETGDVKATIAEFEMSPPEAPLAAVLEAIDDVFDATDLAALTKHLEASDWGHSVLETMRRQSPLSMACTLELVRAARIDPDIEKALAREYRFTCRAPKDGEFLEGIRAAIIDKDRDPVWRHSIESLPPEQIFAMLSPLGADELAL